VGRGLYFGGRPMMQMVAVQTVRVQVRQQRRLRCSSGRRLLQHRGHAVPRDVRFARCRVSQPPAAAASVVTMAARRDATAVIKFPPGLLTPSPRPQGAPFAGYW